MLRAVPLGADTFGSGLPSAPGWSAPAAQPLPDSPSPGPVWRLMNSGAWSSLVQQQVASADSGPRPTAAGGIVGCGGGGGGGGCSRDAQGAVGFASALQASPQALFEMPVDRQQLSQQLSPEISSEMARRDLLVGRRDIPVLRQPQVATPYPPQGFLPMTSAAVSVTETSSGAFPSQPLSPTPRAAPSSTGPPALHLPPFLPSSRLALLQPSPPPSSLLPPSSSPISPCPTAPPPSRSSPTRPSPAPPVQARPTAYLP